MKTNEIHELLKKYWAAETSLDEEKTIYQYFNQSDIDTSLKEFTPLFSYLQEEREISIDVSEQIMTKIEETKQKHEAKIIVFPWRKAIAIAASFLLLLTIGISTYKENPFKKQEVTALDTYQSPEEALEQTMNALEYIAAKMNKGTEKATKSLSKTESLELLN